MLRAGKVRSGLRASALVGTMAALVVGALWAMGTLPSLAGSGRSVVIERDGSDHGFLGVGLTEETDWADGGARVTSVVDGSAAEKAGLEVGDIIVAVDGRTVHGPMAVTKALREKKAGDEVELTVVRDGSRRELSAELSEHRGVFVFSGSTGDDDEPIVIAPRIEWRDCDGEDCGPHAFSFRFGGFGRPRLGVQLTDVTAELREHMGADPEVGVLVSKVIEGTPAEQAGLRVGDLIVAVDGEDIEDVGDLQSAVEDNVGETFSIKVMRDGAPVKIEVTLPGEDDDDDHGPRAIWVSPEGLMPDVAAIRAQVRAAVAGQQDAIRAARGAQRDALRAAREAQREAARVRREVARSVARVRNDAVREQVREAVESARDARRQALRQLPELRRQVRNLQNLNLI